jgi:NAD(P)-dependent dehydrogenase (short-subunit alcohol dehydrogenase family)
MNKEHKGKPAQTQDNQPGNEHQMHPEPEYIKKDYKGSDLLKDKVAIITGGDSGIGRAIAVAFAAEGADVVISYLEENEDAKKTEELVQSKGRKAVLIKGDISEMEQCQYIVDQAIEKLGRLDIIVNNAAMQFPTSSFEEISESQLKKTFETNIYPYFFMVKAALPHLKSGASIINTSSVTAYRGSEHLVDYSSTKGAIIAFTRSLALNLAEKNIRVNGVAPGPIWTPLIPSTFSENHVKKFGLNVPLGRPGEPSEVSPCYVFLASDRASYMTGQFLHPNGGEIINT